MYCPRCGNHPANSSVRFCPSCGLRLDGVVDLLARDGHPANHPMTQESNRKHGIRQGAKLCFSSIVSFLPFFGLCFLFDGPGPLIVPATAFLAGIFWMLYFRIFVDEYELKTPQMITPAAPQQQLYSPPPQAVPGYRAPAEQPQQQSVVEKTTRLLGSE